MKYNILVQIPPALSDAIASSTSQPNIYSILVITFILGVSIHAFFDSRK